MITQNDKLIVISEATYTDLKVVVSDFCQSYNSGKEQAYIRLTKLSPNKHALTFPTDIDFEIFCYLVNYLHYPIDFKWSPSIKAWATTKQGDKWVHDINIFQPVLLFITSDDKEYDNVYMTTSNNQGYKLGFALGEENQSFKVPVLNYISPDIEISQLSNMESEDVK